MDNEACSLFQGKLIRTDYFAGFPRAICAISRAQTKIALESRMPLTLTFVVVWIVRMRQRAPFTIKSIRVTVITCDKSN